jgi:hypothetical protein
MGQTSSSTGGATEGLTIGLITGNSNGPAISGKIDRLFNKVK